MFEKKLYEELKEFYVSREEFSTKLKKAILKKEIVDWLFLSLAYEKYENKNFLKEILEASKELEIKNLNEFFENYYFFDVFFKDNFLYFNGIDRGIDENVKKSAVKYDYEDDQDLFDAFFLIRINYSSYISSIEKLYKNSITRNEKFYITLPDKNYEANFFVFKIENLEKIKEIIENIIEELYVFINRLKEERENDEAIISEIFGDLINE